jgi:CDP-glucose 4,6-dehydratase
MSNRTSSLLSVYKERRCLVTGHTGFKGTWLSIWLQKLGAKVFGLALDPVSSPNLFDAAHVGSLLVEESRGDIRDYALVERVISEYRPEMVFHLAAQPIVRDSYRNPKATFDINCGGTVNLLEAMRNVGGVRTALIITSDKCYENNGQEYSFREIDPLGGKDPYSASKAAAELISSSYAHSFFQQSGPVLATARAGNVIGGGDWANDRIIPDCYRAIMSKRAVALRNPSSIRPWQHVLEPLYGYLILGAKLFDASDSARKNNLSGSSWNFGPRLETCRQVSEVVEAFLKFFEAADARWEHISDKENFPEAKVLKLSSEKAYWTLGWSPKWDFETTVRKTARWYRDCVAGQNVMDLCVSTIGDYMEGLP